MNTNSKPLTTRLHKINTRISFSSSRENLPDTGVPCKSRGFLIGVIRFIRVIRGKRFIQKSMKLVKGG